MRRFAAGYLGISRMEALDPVIALFLEALAQEIHKIAGEIDSMGNRLLDKLSSILIPDENTVAKPAYTVLHAVPLETLLDISVETAFTYASSYRELSFYPVCNTRIYKGDVRYFIHNGSIFFIDKDLIRNCLTRSGKKKPYPENSFWIGLELSPEIKNLTNLSFYIDFHGTDNKKKYLDLLSCMVWEIQGQTIAMEKGLFSMENVSENGNVFDLFSIDDFSRKINHKVKEDFDIHFLTVKGNFDIDNKQEVFPGELKEDFSQTITSKFTGSFLWLKISCPQVFSPEIIETMQLNINVFPVVNKCLHSRTFEINKSIPFIPLKTEENETFLSVHSVYDSSGKRYYDIPLRESEKESFGIYSLNRGGFERYNGRDAREYLISAIDLLSAEQSSFLGNEFDLKNDLKKTAEKVNELIRHLNQVLSDSMKRYEVENYMLLNQSTEEETYFVEYWTTFASEANGISGGSAFSSENLPVCTDSLITLFPTCSGKEAPLLTDKCSLYKRSLSVNRLLVTNEDIRNFCIGKFSHLFKNIQVRNGFVENENSETGFIRVTDVYLISRKEMGKYVEQEGVNFFRQILEKNSPATFNYRVFIEN
jgi:hypothetical protein